MGLEKAIQFINEQLSGRIVTLVYETTDGNLQIITNSNLSDFTLQNQNYTVASTIDSNGKIVYNG
jgi:hypothetical protein